MDSKIILAVVLLLVVAINLFLVIQIRRRANKTADLPDDNGENVAEQAKAWHALLCRWISIGNAVTLVGGGIAAYCDNLLLFTLFVSLPVPLGVAYVYVRRRELGNEGSGQKGKAVIVTVALVFLLELVGILAVSLQSGGDLRLSFTQNALQIHGLYGATIPYRQIKQVSLHRHLPAIKRRSNGFATRRTKLGNFVTNDNKHIMVFAHSDSCFIQIVTKDGEVYYLSSKQAEDTQALFREIEGHIWRR